MAALSSRYHIKYLVTCDEKENIFHTECDIVTHSTHKRTLFVLVPAGRLFVKIAIIEESDLQ